MKKTPLFIAFIFILFFINCSKERTPLDNNNNLIPRISLIDQVKNTKDIATQKIGFNLMTNNEKVKIWKDKFQFIKGVSNLNAEQLYFIDDCIKSLEEDIYSKRDEEKYKIFRLNSENLKDRAIKLFGINTAFELIASLNFTPLKGENSITPLVYPGEKDCKCSIISDWCSGDLDCWRASCEATNTGCGTFWAYACDGKCQTGV